MNKIIIFVSFVYLLLPVVAQSQGMLYVSNLGQTPTGSTSIGSDAWIAQSIITGTNSDGYILNSIQLLMDSASGSPNGFTVSIYSSLTGQPYQNLGNLVGSNPTAGGVFTYTASGLELSTSTPYFVVLTAITPVAQGVYTWSGANGYPVVGSQQWTVDDTYYSSTDGSNWTFHLRQNIFQLGIYATAVPEPSTKMLLGFGGILLLGFLSRRDGKCKS